MLSALDNGVVVSKTRLRHDGGKWYSLIDKVTASATLKVAWHKVQANKGAAGVDGLSIGRFAAKADLYLNELGAALREGTYRPQAVKRVEIPKGDGKTRPLRIPVPDLIRDQGSHCPAGGETRDRADLRGRVLRRQLRLPSGTRVP
ncbi:MAG TPA: hypothetical protein VJX71_25535 [Methylomirabilota bacterium]|nr:hypothetical protein [Methylomirabilota bacterium]